MIYRETGQFKPTYRSDSAVFPIPQDRWVVIAFVFFLAVVMPLIGTEYVFQAILVPVLIYSIAAIGLNLLTGYCGQLSLGTGGFMAVGAVACYKLSTGFPEMNLLVVLLFSGVITAGVGLIFGIPSLRIKGFYLAVATLAAQFFLNWLFNKVAWFSELHPIGHADDAATGILWRAGDRRRSTTTPSVPVLPWCGSYFGSGGNEYCARTSRSSVDGHSGYGYCC